MILRHVRRLGFILLFLASACAGSNPARDEVLIDGTWHLTDYSDKGLIPGTQITLRFEEGQVSGTAGCNHYGGGFQVHGDEILFDSLFSTEMACQEPAGVMEQEQSYLALLDSADRFALEHEVLTIFSGADIILTFGQETEPSAAAPATPEPPTAAPPTQEPTSMPTPVAETPVGFQAYRDPITGVSFTLPDSWMVTSIIAGQSAIFQSYPEDKYVGGEGLAPGDTKCDLHLRPPESSAVEVIQQWETNDHTNVVSNEEITLQSGQVGHQVVVESLGTSIALVAEVNNRAVVLSCFGDPAPFEEIARTLSGFEPTISSPLYESPGGFKQYQDPETGITLAIPGTWMVTGIMPGKRATLQSYPENKYAGGEALEPGDTKCDLFLRGDVSPGEFLDQMKGNEAVTILSEEEISLASGQTADRIEIESVGRSILVVNETNGITVIMTCYGDFEVVDSIAATINAND